MSTVEPTAAHSSAELREDIRKNNARFEEAFTRQDAAALAALYTRDAQVMPSNSAPVVGPAEIQAFWASVMQSGVKSGRLETLELATGGDLAVETGRYQLVIQPPGAAAPVTDEGKYLVVWRQQEDGRWRMQRDMFSSNLPPAPTVH